MAGLNELPSIETAILVHVNFSHESWHEDLEEFRELAVSAGVSISDVLTTRRRTPSAKYFIGLGNAQLLADTVQQLQPDVVIFNHALSPAQERNLEFLLKCRVIDRIRLILDICAQRARTFEGQLQVELAQLNHLATRLVRGWTHLERQKGGIGLRGPGESQLETDRRLLRDRVKTIYQRLEKVRTQRRQGRRARERSAISTISLVGYTNAGKSTLFNRLTQAEVYTADQLFATLDPTLRQLEIKNYGKAILVDTVGFIRHLPHELIEAFRATLEETQAADILLHVQDLTNPSCTAHAEQVYQVLREIKADGIPILQVFNKVDLVPDFQPHFERNWQGIIDKVWLSAKTGAGLEYLMQALAERLAGEMIETQVELTLQQAKLRAQLHANGYIQHEFFCEEKSCWQLNLKMPRKQYEKIANSFTEE